MRQYTILAFTDGRADELRRTIASLDANVVLDGLATLIMIDDSADDDYGNWLERTFPRFAHIHHDQRLGFCATIADGWSVVPPYTDFVFHLEDDFTFNRRVMIGAMADLLDDHHEILQVSLMRQPWNQQEITAGGVVALHPGDYTDRSELGHDWMEHRRYFTTNPSLYRRALTRQPWPESNCEGMFSHHLLADPDVRFAVWGRRDDTPWVTHIGAHRVGTGY